MAHEVSVQLEAFTDDEHHKIRNFLDALWAAVCDSGWASWGDLDATFNGRVKPGAVFSFRVTTRRKLRDALALVDRTIASHMMALFTTVTHRSVDG